jgi:hypothetical protein
LVEQAPARGPAGSRELLGRDRERRRRMVALRLDRRPQGRVAPSDVIQEACLNAARRLPEYHKNPTMPFFLWLRLLTGDSMTASGWAEARERPRIGRSLPWPTTDWDIALRHAAGSPSSGPGIRRHLPASTGRASRSGSSAGRPSRWSRMPNRPDPEPPLVAAAAPGPGSDRPVPGQIAEPAVQRRGVGTPSRFRFSQSEGSLP